MIHSRREVQNSSCCIQPGAALPQRSWGVLKLTLCPVIPLVFASISCKTAWGECWKSLCAGLGRALGSEGLGLCCTGRLCWGDTRFRMVFQGNKGENMLLQMVPEAGGSSEASPLHLFREPGSPLGVVLVGSASTEQAVSV